MDVSIQKYLAFVKTVECGSFTRAAGVLNYSQSGISRMIGDLEREWQVALLERGKAGVRLTSEGTRLLPYAKRVCSEYEKLQAEVDEINGLKSGLIRIGTFSSVATHWLPNIIREFQKEYPGIDYELILGDYTEIETWIEEGRVDCGFLRLPARKALDSLFLEQDRLLVVLPEGHPWRRWKRFLYPRCAGNLSCCWKKEQRQKYRKFSREAVSVRKYISLHGMIMRSWLW